MENSKFSISRAGSSSGQSNGLPKDPEEPTGWGQSLPKKKTHLLLTRLTPETTVSGPDPEASNADGGPRSLKTESYARISVPRHRSRGARGRRRVGLSETRGPLSHLG